MIVQLQSELRMYELLDQVEINVHLTGKVKQDEDFGKNCLEVGDDKNEKIYLYVIKIFFLILGSMESILKFNRPEWPSIFSQIRSTHNGTKIGMWPSFL